MTTGREVSTEELYATFLDFAIKRGGVFNSASEVTQACKLKATRPLSADDRASLKTFCTAFVTSGSLKSLEEASLLVQLFHVLTRPDEPASEQASDSS